MDFLQWLRQLEFDYLFELLVIVTASLLCITVHETCHGLVAFWMGDNTAKRQSRLTLNPLCHVDPMGLVMMALARFGWAKPVPVDMRNFRKPKLGMALTAIAGPVSNVLLALAALLVRALSYPLYLSSSGVVWEYVILFLEYLVILSAGLAVFNLFPVPPLDGSKVIFSFFPDRWYWKLMRYERYGFLILAALLFLNVLDTPLFYLRDGLIRLLSLIADPVYYFVSTIIRG